MNTYTMKSTLILFVLITLSLTPPIASEAVLSLVRAQYSVREGDHLEVEVLKTGTAASPINVVLQVQDPSSHGGDDFIATSRAAVFPAGVESLQKSFLFSTKDDLLPEEDEDFIVSLRVTNGDGTVDAKSSKAELVIAANDDAFGIFGFVDTNTVYAEEMADSDGLVSLQVERKGGNFGEVVLQCQVFGEDASAELDISPVLVNVSFYEGEWVKPLNLLVRADEEPESRENFQVVLTGVFGGESVLPVSNRPSILETEDTLTLVVRSNDAPVSFLQATYSVDEDSFTTTVDVMVSRGHVFQDDGTSSPIHTNARVTYFIKPNTATPNEDYTSKNGSLTFAPGSTQESISIEILPDDIPEITESFTLVLDNTEGDIVLVDPFRVTVMINDNDDPNGVFGFKANGSSLQEDGAAHLNEDAGVISVDVEVERRGGTYGEVSLEWELTHSSGDVPSSSRISPHRGQLVFRAGETIKMVKLSVTDDNLPQPAKKFLMSLLPQTLQGGGRVDGLIQLDVLLEDSDAAHGVISFTAQDTQTIVTDTSPRKLALTLVREGGTLGSVHVECSVKYSDALNNTEVVFLDMLPAVIVFLTGQTSQTLYVDIRDDVFLRESSAFVAIITKLSLAGAVAVYPFHSPALGHRDLVEVRVSPDIANGEVGLLSTQSIYVDEPEDETVGSLQVLLPVRRIGSNGHVTVYWSIQGTGFTADHVTNTDLQPMAGSLTMVSGQSTADIVFSILPDDEPETTEEMTLTLNRVEPSDLQRLSPGLQQVQIMIRENDSPGGRFQLSPDTQKHITVQEELDPIEIRVIRTGGALVTREVELFIDSPNGDAEFYGATSVLKFYPGDTQKTVTVLARGDGIPELTEHFELRLQSFGESPVNFGSLTRVNITVLENEQPYGAFTFSNESQTHTGESKHNVSLVARLRVERNMGRFGAATVEWEVQESNASLDLQPLSGMLRFEPGVGELDIVIQTLPDELPEEDETFTILLYNATNGAIVGDQSHINLTIVKNDERIYFTAPTDVRITEGSTTTLTVHRDGPTDAPVFVKLRTLDGTAVAMGLDYVAVETHEMVFAVGETEQSVSVLTLQDELPETDEVFYLELYDAQGDVSVFTSPRASVTIAANDNANGVFSFSQTSVMTAEEGKPVNIEIQREKGHFSRVQVHWGIYSNSSFEPLEAGQDFVLTEGNVTFNDLQTVAYLELRAVEDQVPEFDETFKVLLYSVSGGGPGDELPSLSPVNTEITVIIVENDDPWGLFTFTEESRQVSVAEDFLEGEEIAATVSLLVERQNGLSGEVKVAWEVFSHQLAGGGNLPEFVSVLCVGEAASGLVSVPEAARHQTNTVVYRFDGCKECITTVPRQYQPSAADIEDGFSMSGWIRPQLESTTAYILVKSSEEGEAGRTEFYGLRLHRGAAWNGGSTTRLQFVYSTEHSLEEQLVQSDHLGAELEDGDWHHITLNIHDGEASFYLDGQIVGLSTLVSYSVRDGPGVLYIGGASPGKHVYVGYMQDVRIFSRKLNQREINELYETPSKSDLQQISGYLTFPAGVRTQSLELSTLEDAEEEADEIFSVRLISASGGATVAEVYSMAIVTVLKSDNANGLFGFSAPCEVESEITENSTYKCPVQRTKGDAGEVKVTWEVVPLAESIIDGTDELADQDFVNASGTIEFLAGEREQFAYISLFDDHLPELEEYFMIRLVSVETGDGVSGSTPTSGASLDAPTANVTVAVPPSDQPYGLFQIMGHIPSMHVTKGFLEPLRTKQKVQVAEEQGHVTLYVVRSQGLEGSVTVEWRTKELTAKSYGKTPPDFMASVGVLSFPPGEYFQEIRVPLVDNELPEAGKEFTVELLNGGGGAELGPPADVVTVHIQHSDFAHGLFRFEAESMQVYTAEPDDLVEFGEIKAAQFKVVREGGSLGHVNLTWSITSVKQEHSSREQVSPSQTSTDPSLDILTTSGVVQFTSGLLEAVISVVVRGDTEPELEEGFLVQLVNVSQGTLGDEGTTAELIIEASDDPYGKFVISATQGPTYVMEGNRDVAVSILRSSESGHYGQVLVDYMTVHPSQLLPHIPGGQRRADFTDFNATQGSVIFEPGQVSANFSLVIHDDETPEMDEAVYVRLTGVQLLEPQQQRQVENSPRLGQESELYGEIIISENDDPHGVLDLSVSRVKVTEDQHNSFVSVIRSRGDFGSISVKVAVDQGTATLGLDYSVTVTEIHFSAGETLKHVPVAIIDDSLPELDETFTIRLLDDLSGGARLGQLIHTLVTIETSDDLNGAFVFERAGITVREPGSGERQTVSVSVIRLGGTLGVVTVDWTAMTHGGNGEVGDISPSSGQLYFVSNEAHQYLTVDVLQDELPEPQETIVLQLSSATNGGRVVGERSRFELHISPNDNPHGEVEFLQPEHTVFEPQAESLQYVAVNRTGGTEGQLRVYYTIQELDLLHEATKSGDQATDYFYSPKYGKPLPMAGTRINVENKPQPLKACAEFCLLTEACEAFDFHPDKLDCNWFSEGDYIALDNRTGYQFYGKDSFKTSRLYTQQAQMLKDFTTTVEQTIVIDHGQSTGLIPVHVTPDTLPELPEIFIIHLFHIELIGASPDDPENVPRLGSRTDAYVTIAANDDANGVFRIYSNSPRALKSGQLVEVEERESLSVEFIVERQGGGIGTVGVSWRVVPGSTTATRGTDFIADGATLSFSDGELYRAITLAVEDDVLPENDETVVIELYSPTGGAELGQPDHNQATLVIMANDHVAGLVGFRKLTFLAKEGDHLTLQLWRSSPAVGQITVTWEIQAVSRSDPPEKRFRNYAGTLYFDNGEVQKQVVLNVMVDNEPKIAQEYKVLITNILTEGVRETGAAGVDPVSGTATITIEGGNEPHGVFGFSSPERRATEMNGVVNLPVNRKFGSIGAVRIHYRVKHGSLRPVGTMVEAAMAGADFTAQLGHVTMYAGETSVNVPVSLLDDEEPEIDEVFLVTLDSVELMTHGNSSFLPRIENSESTAEVIITANDGTQGEVIFPQQYANMTVSEGRQEVALVVRRTKGTFGAVSVFCFAQNTKEGAVRGEDFNFDPMDIQFGPGVSEQLITVEILEDELPEPDEGFEIVLASPKLGLQVGQPGKAVITILASDEASGVVSFDSTQNVTIVEPSADTQAGSTAYLTLVRAPGAFGVVKVPFTVESSNFDQVTDISPTEGVVIFKDKQDTAVLELQAVPDDAPEEVEVFTVVLGTPGGGARLGRHVTKTISIDRNDAPYGKLTLHGSTGSGGARASKSTIEESQGVLYVDVLREQGSLGWVSVDLVTTGNTAAHQPGPRLHAALLHQMSLPARSQKWYTFQAKGRFYALALTEDTLSEATTAQTTQQENTELYIWQGALVQSQTLLSEGGLSSACSFVLDGASYLLTTGHGVQGNSATARIYTVQKDATLALVQEFPTEGASGSLFYTHRTQSYVMIHGLTGSRNEPSGLSRVYVWESSSRRFSTVPVQVLETKVVRDSLMLTIEAEKYLVLANYYDLKTHSYEVSSVAYRLDSNGLWTIHQFLPTKGAVSVTSFRSAGNVYLGLGNNRDNAGLYEQTVVIYQWSAAVQAFEHVQSLDTVDVQSVATFMHESHIYLTVSSVSSTSDVFLWNLETSRFTLTLSLPGTSTMHPLIVPRAETGVKVTEIFLLAILPSRQNRDHQDEVLGQIYQVYNMANESDYIPRHSRLSFAPGQTNLTVGVYIHDDSVPEGPEQLIVELHNPRGGAELGQQSALMVDILASDSGHGIVQFAEDSRVHYTEELSTGDVTVLLSVVRTQGHSGHVIVTWAMSGEHNGNYDVAPQQGQVEFADGQSASTISLTVKDDGIPELEETSYITLLEVVKTGSEVPDRGAVIGDHSIAKVIVLPSDSPHGVVLWERLDHVTDEPTAAGASSRVTLTLHRSQGTLGEIRVLYMTSEAVDVPASSRAESGVDYLSVQGSVEMAAGVTRATVTVLILDDNTAELSESFVVNITGVQLFGEVSGTAIPPSVNQPGRLATVTIRENDNARGVLNFAVSRNTENRVDTYEGSPPVRLPVERSVGSFGEIEVTWRAFPREATLVDFTPSGGTLRFKSGQTLVEIEISAIDDEVPELLETFEVRLTQVTSGGASIGTDSVVSIGIIKNDSPSGVFSFVQTEVSVLESQSSFDPDGVASVEIQRQGTDGEVTVHWRLDAQAVNDFLQPLAGSIRFAPGQFKQTVSVRTKPDEILEGTERFNLSLVSVSNNADISPSRGFVSVTIEADPGAGGIVSIAQQSQVVYIGEPTAENEGSVTIMLERGPGRFGNVDVTWLILQPDSSAFTHTQGITTIRDGNGNGAISIQAKDDSLAELRRNFELVLTSVTGGASIGEEYDRSRIVYVANDHPHGLFEFQSASEILVNEESKRVAVTVRRRYGHHGTVIVTYTTEASDAVGRGDFMPSAGVLRFEDAVTEQQIFVQIVDDSEPEGEEHFYVNLTKLELVSPVINASIVGGYQLDMPPSLGPVSSQKVVIGKNDNAEGMVQFAEEANNIIASEIQGVVSIPLERVQGSWGELEVHFTVYNGSALLGRDFLVSHSSVLVRDRRDGAVINITIVNDREREFEETFMVQLNSVTGGGTLGSQRMITVIIAKSDFPNGKLSFLQPISREIENPESLLVLPVTLERSEGLLGRQMLKWRIMGPNNVNRLLTDTSDLSSRDLEGQEVTQGSLTWEDGEAGSKYFNLQIMPHSGWEVAETFVLVVYDVACFPTDVGTAQMNPEAMAFTLTVRKHGDPNGLVKFTGISQVHRQIEEPVSGHSTMVFPIARTRGTLGDIQVQWFLQGPLDVKGKSSDTDRSSGEVSILAGQAEGQVTLQLLADDVPEVDETFTVVLTGVKGGAEVDPLFNTSVFTVRYNDYPHGRFSIASELQSVTVAPPSLHRQLRLNVTRNAGTVGRVKVNVHIIYDQAKTGQMYVPATGSLIFNDSRSNSVTSIDMEPGVFLALYSTFTVTLTEVIYLGDDVTQRPDVIPELSVAKVTVSKMAANSQVGFEHSVVAVNETTHQAEVNIYRSGSYGPVTVRWRSSLSDTEERLGFTLGQTVPETSAVELMHGVERQILHLQLYPDMPQQAELFTLELDLPITSVGGGARLLPGKSFCRLEPHGVIGFVKDSRETVTQEPEKGTRQVVLGVFRQYGSMGEVQFTYSTVAASAQRGEDFVDLQHGTVIMKSKQTLAEIYVQIKSDTEPEVDETFLVNITKVIAMSEQSLSDLSPRVSLISGTATVTIRSNSNPYGVVSIATASTQPVSEPGSVELLITRSGGSFGEISLQIRTVGGGESWDQYVGSSPSPQHMDTVGSHNDTIGQALAARDSTSRATAGQDYQVLDTTLVFQDGETEKRVTVYILDDVTAEGDETLYVYISPQTDGVGVALPSLHSGRKGYTSIIVLRNDFWSGWVGFYGENSSLVTADEDQDTAVTLTVERRNATFGAVQLQWRAVLDKASGLVTSPHLDLTQQLQTTSGVADCPALSSLCSFNIRLRDDSVPENETHFWVELTAVTDGADIDPSRRFSRVRVLPSDFPNGMIQFAEDSQYVLINRETDHVTLNIKRWGFLDKTVRVPYKTVFVTESNIVFNNEMVSSAIPHSDYKPVSGELVFTAGQSLQAVRVELDLSQASLGSYPKAFLVELHGVGGSAELGVGQAVVMIVDREEEEVWNVWALAQQQIDTQTQLHSLLSQLLNLLSSPINKKDLSILKTVLDKVLKTAENVKFTEGIKQSIMDVLCTLLDPQHYQSSLGEWHLSKYMESFADLYLGQAYPCQDCCSPMGELLRSPECQHATFSVAKWPANKINGYQYEGQNGDYLTLPDDILDVSDKNDEKCHDVLFVEYSVQHWFVLDGNNDEFLNRRIFTLIVDGDEKSGAINTPVRFRVHAAQSGIAVRKAECVYLDETTSEWRGGDGICEMTNNLALALDDYVDCSCKHLSHYAVRSRNRDPSQIGYPLWYYISCIIAITALMIVIVNHHVCSSIKARFTMNLLMHFIFAIVAAELCYLIDAYLSPNHILDIPSGKSSNYRCIIMAFFTHYFFLAQFTWMLTLAFNFHKILVLNDEHTQRKYVQFALLGWGLPALLVILFYIVTYVVFRFLTSSDPNQIYGDVHDNGDICFVRNTYAGLVGVVLPCVMCLCVVGVVLLQAFQITQQWQAYDDIYNGRHNLHELRLLLLFWLCFLVQWLWGGLHLAYTQLWMLVIYCVFTIATGLLGLVVYAVIRIPCMPCSKPHLTQNGQSERIEINPNKVESNSLDNSVSTVTGSIQDSLIPEKQSWQPQGFPMKPSEIPVKRKPVSSVIDRRNVGMGGAYAVNPASLSPPLSGSHSYSSHTSTVMSGQPSNVYTRASSTDLDELIIALKTSGVRPPPSDTSCQDTEIWGGYDFQAVREAANMGNNGGGHLAGHGADASGSGSSRQGYNSLSRSMGIVDTHL